MGMFETHSDHGSFPAQWRIADGMRDDEIVLPPDSQGKNRMLPLYTPAVPHQEELGGQLKCYFPDCGYDRTFDSVADLNQHVTEVHRSDGVGIKCPECSTIFPYLPIFMAHIASHAAGRTYVCEHQDCAAAFRTATKRRHHTVVVHTGVMGRFSKRGDEMTIDLKPDHQTSTCALNEPKAKVICGLAGCTVTTNDISRHH